MYNISNIHKYISDLKLICFRLEASCPVFQDFSSSSLYLNQEKGISINRFITTFHVLSGGCGFP